jgi:hypothetical protein
MKLRHHECPLCVSLSDWEHVMQKVGHEEEDTFPPDEVGRVPGGTSQ